MFKLNILGSPPRMRGKRRMILCSKTILRITPADAGKTGFTRYVLNSQRDHPRGCGENLKRVFCHWAKPGSPPRMRGKPRCNISKSEKTRITPADAGKTQAQQTANILTWDHPRGCGENQFKGLDNIYFKGSPPRMRGKHEKMKKENLKLRITPADAGKTKVGDPQDAVCKDHPRGCGENCHIVLNFR